MRIRLAPSIGALFATILVALTGCKTTGTGSGEMHNGVDSHVSFAWSSHDSVSGDMTATFSDGRVFSGRYFQITSDSRVDRLAPLWDGWGRRWRDWPYWYPEPGPEFVKHYSGRVLANLSTAGGEHMRCRFRLVHPSSGMAGGGEGRCQLPGGKTVDATFPNAR